MDLRGGGVGLRGGPGRVLGCDSGGGEGVSRGGISLGSHVEDIL